MSHIVKKIDNPFTEFPWVVMTCGLTVDFFRTCEDAEEFAKKLNILGDFGDELSSAVDELTDKYGGILGIDQFEFMNLYKKHTGINLGKVF